MEKEKTNSSDDDAKVDPVNDAPKKGPHGEDLVVESLKTSKNGRFGKRIVVKAQGIAIESYDDDGRGLDRAWSTLMAMTPG